jgi:hypothetical protein
MSHVLNFADLADIVIFCARRDTYFEFELDRRLYRSQINNSFDQLVQQVASQKWEGNDDGNLSLQMGCEFFNWLPDKLKSVLYEERKSQSSLLIVNENCTLPWESMVIHRNNEDHIMLGKAFAISHWYQEFDRPTTELFLNNATIIKGKGIFFNHFERTINKVDINFRKLEEKLLTDKSSLKEAISYSRTGFWMIIADLKKLAQENDNSYAVQISEYLNLRACDIPIIFSSVKNLKPLVILHVCSSTSQVKGFKVGDNWTRKFIEAGAGAVISTHSLVSESDHGLFSEKLCSELLKGKSISEACRIARENPLLENPQTFTAFANPKAYYVDQDLKSPTRIKQNPLMSSRFWLRNRNKAIAFLAFFFCIITPALGLQATRSREFFINSPNLTYSFFDYFYAGISTLGYGLGSFLSTQLWTDRYLLTCKLFLILSILALLVLQRFLSGNEPKKVMKRLFLIPMLAMILIGHLYFGSLITVGVHARNVFANDPDSRQLSRNPYDQIAHRSFLLLINDSPSDKYKRQQVYGVLVACLVSVMLIFGITSGFKLYPYRPAFCALFGLLAIALFFQLPTGFAFVKWGISYPKVEIQNLETMLPERGGSAICCVYDVSAGGSPQTFFYSCDQGSGFLSSSKSMPIHFSQIPGPSQPILTHCP